MSNNKNLLTKLPDEIFRAVYKHIYDDAINDIKKMDYLGTLTADNIDEFCHKRTVRMALFYGDDFLRWLKYDIGNNRKLIQQIENENRMKFKQIQLNKLKDGYIYKRFWDDEEIYFITGFKLKKKKVKNTSLNSIYEEVNNTLDIYDVIRKYCHLKKHTKHITK